MAILTLPVVIVATEEGLRNVPQGLKAGSYALGATKAETVLYTILPMASPGIMTGVILAMPGLLVKWHHSCWWAR